MSKIDEIGERDGWRCWLCDEPVDADMSVNDSRGPSIDQRITKAKAKKKSKVARAERLAHRGCNTGKGGKEAVVPWADGLFVIDPVPIIASIDRLDRKGGREIMARCPSQEDADRAMAWIVDRVSRLEPGLAVTSEIQHGGGQFLLVLKA